MKNIQKIIFLSLVSAICLSSNIFAQAETEKKNETEIVIIKKVVDENGVESEEKIVLTGDEAEKYIKEQGIKITEKPTGKEGEVEMTVEVTAEGSAYEEMTVEVTKEKSTEDVNIWISEDGEEHKMKEGQKMIFIDSDGKELPEDVKKMLEEKGIDIDSLLEEGGEQMTTEKKNYKVVKIDDDGNEKILEWDGEGEMPQEMRELMEEHGIEGKMKVKRKKIMIEDDVDVDVQDGTKKIKIKKKENGNETVEIFELNEGEEMPQEVLDLLKEHDVDLDNIPEDGKVRIRIEKDSDGNIREDHGATMIKKMVPQNKAQLGVMIEDSKAGVVVVDLVDNGAAKNAGVLVDDVITKVDKVVIKTYEDLVNALADKEVGDKVKLTVLRDGKLKKIKANMQAAQAMEKETSYRTEHKVLKIEGGDIVECIKEEEVESNATELTEREIEVIEEKIVETTGQEVHMHSSPNTLDIQTLDLYPNPTDGNIRVSFVIDNKLATNVKVIDIAGRTVYEKSLDNFNGAFDESIDLPKSKLGTLVLVISQGKNVFTEKILLN